MIQIVSILFGIWALRTHRFRIIGNRAVMGQSAVNLAWAMIIMGVVGFFVPIIALSICPTALIVGILFAKPIPKEKAKTGLQDDVNDWLSDDDKAKNDHL